MRCLLCIAFLARGVTAACEKRSYNQGCAGTQLSGVPFGAGNCMAACLAEGKANVQSDGYVYIASVSGCICCDGSTSSSNIGIDFYRCTLPPPSPPISPPSTPPIVGIVELLTERVAALETSMGGGSPTNAAAGGGLVEELAALRARVAELEAQNQCAMFLLGDRNTTCQLTAIPSVTKIKLGADGE